LAVNEEKSEDQRFSLTAKKALEINLNSGWYGTFAEIGAGQEVARWFFYVGGAAGTVAKSVSAYDMTISDSMYGRSKRYVTRERLESMLEYEYLQCQLTLNTDRGGNTQFFAFADTVVAKAYMRDNECHGWLGIKYQTAPKKDPCSVMIHCRMLEPTAQQQQESLGVLGVNLIHAALTQHHDPYNMINSLLDDLSRDKIEIDAVVFSGNDFKHVDKRLVSLRLVQTGLTDAAIFDPSGEPMIPQEVLYKKNVMMLRGRFRPFTLLHNDMLAGAATKFFCGPEDESTPYESCVYREDTEVVLEMTTRDLMDSGDLLDWTSEIGLDEASFITRIEALSSIGYLVMVSRFQRYFKLAAYMRRYTDQAVVIALGVPAIKELFNPIHYKDLPGGILENFGRLLSYDQKLYVYPTVDSSTGRLITAKDIKVAPSVQKLYDYIYERGTIIPIDTFDKEVLTTGDVSKIVVESIQKGTSEWESLVPRHVREQIITQKLWGYSPMSNTVSIDVGKKSAAA